MVRPNRRQPRENSNRTKLDARLVSFSKRKKGLLNKCMELCLLCNPQLACIIISPTGKITLFGNSDVDVVLDHFLNRTVPPPSSITNQNQAQEYNRVKGKLKMTEKNVKNQENVAVEYGQWIDEQLNRATTVEEVDRIIRSIELSKQKLETRIKNFPSSSMNGNSNMATSESYQFSSTISKPSSNIFPNYVSAQLGNSEVGAFYNNWNISSSMPINLSSSSIPSDINSFQLEATNDCLQSAINPINNIHEDFGHNFGPSNISRQYVSHTDQDFVADQNLSSGNLTYEEILSILNSDNDEAI